MGSLVGFTMSVLLTLLEGALVADSAFSREWGPILPRSSVVLNRSYLPQVTQRCSCLPYVHDHDRQSVTSAASRDDQGSLLHAAHCACHLDSISRRHEALPKIPLLISSPKKHQPRKTSSSVLGTAVAPPWET